MANNAQGLEYEESDIIEKVDERRRKHDDKSSRSKGGSRRPENERGENKAGAYMEDTAAESREKGYWHSALYGKREFQERKPNAEKSAKKEDVTYASGGIFEIAERILAQKKILGCFFNKRESKERGGRREREGDGLIEGRRSGGEENKFKNEREAARKGTKNNNDNKGHSVEIPNT